MSGLDLSSLAPREPMDAQGVVVDELIVSIGKEATRKIPYPILDVRGKSRSGATYLSRLIYQNVRRAVICDLLNDNLCI